MNIALVQIASPDGETIGERRERVAALIRSAASADLIVRAAWPAARLEHWRLFTSVRAVEEQVLLVACNATGTQAGVELAGHSRVVDPWGTVLAEASTAEEIIWCETDPAIVPNVRQQFPVLADRLPSYADLTR